MQNSQPNTNMHTLETSMSHHSHKVCTVDVLYYPYSDPLQVTASHTLLHYNYYCYCYYYKLMEKTEVCIILIPHNVIVRTSRDMLYIH